MSYMPSRVVDLCVYNKDNTTIMRIMLIIHLKYFLFYTKHVIPVMLQFILIRINICFVYPKLKPPLATCLLQANVQMNTPTTTPTYQNRERNFSDVSKCIHVHAEFDSLYGNAPRPDLFRRYHKFRRDWAVCGWQRQPTAARSVVLLLLRRHSLLQRIGRLIGPSVLATDSVAPRLVRAKTNTLRDNFEKKMQIVMRVREQSEASNERKREREAARALSGIQICFTSV